MGMEQKGSESALILTSGASGRINALFSVRALKSLLVLINTLILVLLLPFRIRKGAAVIRSSLSTGDHHQQNHNEICTKKGCASVRARRALAIRRVLQDASADEALVTDYWLFVTPRGDTLFTQSWTPLSLQLRGVVVVMHGLNEHSGRYSDFAKHLNSHGFKVYGMDWIGHGGSDGLHGYVHSLDYAVADLKSFLEKVIAENPTLPCFCFGHSTGAAIILKAMLDPKVESRISGLVLTSPAVGVQPSHPIFTVLAPVFSLFLPRLQMSAANKTANPVSRDPEALVAKYSDPQVYTGSIRVRTGYQILLITNHLQQNMHRLKVPFLVLHGGADTVTDPNASAKLYREASSPDKTIKLYDGLLHDLLFEPERDEIVNDITKWLNSRV